MTTDWGEPVIIEPERELYVPVERYLKTGFLHSLKPRFGSVRLIPQIVANLTIDGGGMWTQPDIVAVAISRFKYAAEPKLDVFSFEIKPRSKGNIAAVHQALAHSKFVNYSYLVWNRSADLDKDDGSTVVAEACRAFGVGLILAHDPHNMLRYVVTVPAVRQELSAAAADDFIEARFSLDCQRQILDGLRVLSVGA